jgi:hypothetical protein
MNVYPQRRVASRDYASVWPTWRGAERAIVSLASGSGSSEHSATAFVGHAVLLYILLYILVLKQVEWRQRTEKLHISKEGDPYLRTLMVQSAHHILGPFGADSDLRRWGLKLAERGGKNAKKREVVAVARKLAILLHRLAEKVPVPLVSVELAGERMAWVSLRITTSGPFSQSNTCGTSLGAGNSCTIDVRFGARQAGTYSGTLDVTDNAPGSPQEVILKGNATCP